jgi:hypothetical protein
MITSRLQLGKCRRLLSRAALACLLGAALSSCSSVPGETLASGGVKRDVGRRVLAQANSANPGCKNQRIADTEVLELHPDGKVAAERWTVEQCGQRLNYRVVFPANGTASAILVRAE